MTSIEHEPLSPEWDERVRSELEPTENLVWAAQPLPVSAGRTLRDTWPWMLFGVVWLGFTVFGYFMWQSSRQTRKEIDDDFERNFQGEFFREARERRRKDREGVSAFDVVPLVVAGGAGLVGVGLLLAPLWLTRSRQFTRSHSCYALTNQRALVWEPADGGLQVHNYPPSRLEALKRIERSDGSGDLIFEEWTVTYPVTVTDSAGHSHTEMRQGINRRGFLNVAAVREIERLLKQTLLR